MSKSHHEYIKIYNHNIAQATYTLKARYYINSKSHQQSERRRRGRERGIRRRGRGRRRKKRDIYITFSFQNTLEELSHFIFTKLLENLYFLFCCKTPPWNQVAPLSITSFSTNPHSLWRWRPESLHKTNSSSWAILLSTLQVTNFLSHFSFFPFIIYDVYCPP